MSCSIQNRAFSAAIAVSLSILPTLPAAACLNDRDSDSLAEEGGKLPNVISVITGRFERNPPLFYKMRLARVSREIAVSPKTWSLYDDAAVACDRLHDDTAALRWIQQKRAAMQRFHVTTATPEGKEAWYRYHANAGTFHAHRFLQNGAKPEQVGTLNTGIRHIEKALVLKPDAHFGRERYQLGAMRWISKVKRGVIGMTQSPRPSLLTEVLTDSPSTPAAPAKSAATLAPYRSITNAKRMTESAEAIEGLSGLIVLGNVWESVDVFAALAQSLATHGEGKVAYLAQLRCEELLRTGHHSFDASIKGTPVQIAQSLSRRSSAFHSYLKGITNERNVQEKFAELRADADMWQVARTRYLVTQLSAGHHPDTSTDFWKGFAPAPTPALDIKWSKEAGGSFGNWFMRHPMEGVLLFLLILIGGCVATWYVLRFLFSLLPWSRKTV